MIQFDAVVKDYGRGAGRVQAVRGLSADIAAGSFVSIVGPSGSGKSTLLHLAAGLERPTAGRVRVAGQDLAALSDDALTLLRRRRLGLVFQFFNLLPTLTAEENVCLPLLLDGRAAAAGAKRARVLLAMVGLEARRGHRPEALSGGECQRVAIARALVTEPPLVLADEPTGSLDSATGREVLTLLAALSKERGFTVVMVTHDLQAAEVGDRVIALRDGRIHEDRPAQR